MPKDTHYHSFFIRVQWRSETELQGKWYSEVDHIQSGHRYTFETEEDLVAYLQRELKITARQSPI